ncbi:PepSY-associated TM helix domain-containing protein [Flavobacterium sp. SUN052]|uniref:PepSY-associated TM helix domain-containing protein n=1 Tax=Flavobacterium sp. SUN052 TaxID=3002441 RepID=UPI00237E9EE3|nr:PepSY-associated TM helix domain-containing protein [Flavobacterium sp. SUN052]MEC4005711.1 PepSY-associated TM helix domain-containing protein [Flavobacterium sp. SUN052]
MNQQKIRNLHRDLGYFYIGLIISFAFSGILMNHRESWHPEKYTVETKEITINIPKDADITEKYAEEIGKKIGIDDKIRRHKVKDNKLQISFEKNDVEIDLKSGKGEIVTFSKTPIISQAMKLHKTTSNWWIYYSDIFGLSLITIAITGAIMIKVGNKTFSKRGWKLALAGLIVPLLILLFV